VVTCHISCAAAGTAFVQTQNLGINIMKIKTNELTRAALNWAVSKCEGHIRPDGGLYEGHQGRVFHPSTNWAHGGPIIEREFIETRLFSDDGSLWYARLGAKPFPLDAQMTGPTPLIAAMRCYVAFKLGDEVEIPEELIGQALAPAGA
jgi:Protein of unknown function (DUF2591)